MDIVKLIFVCIIYMMFSTSHAAVFDMGEHSGIIRDSNGNFSQVSANGSVRSLNSNTLSFAEKINFQTSKGIFSTDIVRTASVDVARIGKTVRTVAVASNPIGMTIAAVSLVCELTDICNLNGVWEKYTAPDQITDLGQSVGWTIGSNIYSNSTLAQAIAAEYGGAGYGVISGSCQCMATDFQWTPSQFGGAMLFKLKNASGGYLSGQLGANKQTVYTPSQSSHSPATSSDWDSKESLMNDDRFVPELFAKDQPIPVQTPSLPSPVTVPIGKETKTTKDGSGNVTGTEEVTTEAKIEQPSGAENPTNNPNILKVSETTINNTYNVNNQLTGSTTTTTNPGSEPQPQDKSYEIEIDNMQDTPLQEKAVVMPFDTNSWGSGSCPAPRSVSYHYGQLELTFQPACDFADGIRPIVLILAGFVALYILTGAVRND